MAELLTSSIFFMKMNTDCEHFSVTIILFRGRIGFCDLRVRISVSHQNQILPFYILDTPILHDRNVHITTHFSLEFATNWPSIPSSAKTFVALFLLLVVNVALIGQTFFSQAFSRSNLVFLLIKKFFYSNHRKKNECLSS